MAVNIQEIPRIHCFEGPRIDLNDICGTSEECGVTECLWHRKKEEISSLLGVDNNRTEAMPKIS